MVGGYAGWSFADAHSGGQRDLHWGGPELRSKPRAFQNCCGGSGTHAFFIAWKNAARFENGTLSVNLHIDKLLPEAEIRCYQPYKGLLTIDLKRPCKVRVRIPEFVGADSDEGEPRPARSRQGRGATFSNWATGRRGRSSRSAIPCRCATKIETVGNPGFRQYPYRVTWKGDTVVR